jgi:drug/metabolite transporter (DMT)-like permease
MSKKTLAFIAILVAALLWSTAGVTAKTLVQHLDPFVMSFYRFFFASLFILPFFLREKLASVPWKKLILPAFVGALNAPLYFLGIQRTTANSGSLIYTAAPLVTAILSYVLIREKNSLSKWIGIFIGLIGVMVIILLPVFETGTNITGNLNGNIYIAFGMLCWTVYAILCRNLRKDNQVSTVTMTSFFFFISTILSLCLAVLTKQPLFPPQLFTPFYIGMLLYAAIFITLITFFLYQWAIGHVGVTTASFKQYIETVFAIVLNNIFLGEKMTFGFIIGSILVFAGVTIATIGKIRNVRKVHSYL